MTKPAKPGSDLINCSLDMGINKFSISIKLHCRQIPLTLFVLFSLPLPPSSNPTESLTFPPNLCKPYCFSSRGDKSPLTSLARTGQHCATLQSPCLQNSGYFHIPKTICPKEWQLPSTHPCFPVDSMPIPYGLGNQKTRIRSINYITSLGKLLGSSQLVAYY